MRFMVTVPANEKSEKGELPPTEVFATMLRYNEGLADASVLLAAEGLRPSSEGARVTFSGDEAVVTDGPFAETKELIGGFWLLEAGSLDEAVEWIKKAPLGGGVEVQISPLYEFDDFGDAFTPELREKADRLQRRLAERNS